MSRTSASPPIPFSTAIDYSAVSTIVGFTAYATKEIMYFPPVGKLCVVKVDLRSTAGNGNGTTASITLPFNASAWGGTQYFQYHSLNNNTTQASSTATIAPGSNILVFSASAATGTAWNTGTTRNVQGTFEIYIA